MRVMRVLLAVIALSSLWGTAMAAERNLWRNPGAQRYATTHLVAMGDDERRAAFVQLKLPEHLVLAAVAATSRAGEQRPLVDDECFDRQLFRVRGKVAASENVCVAFARPDYDRSAERWRITDTDGTVYEITDPYVCDNISIRKMPPLPSVAVAPPAGPRCFRVNLDYRVRPSALRPVEYATPEQLGPIEAWVNPGQSVLYPDTSFAFVLVHLDLSEVERVALLRHECFGYGDETGFHRQIAECLRFCARGSYPSQRAIEEIAQKRGIRLPSEEPKTAFAIPLAGGQGYLSLPIEFADRYGLYCVGVQRYRVRLESAPRSRSQFAWDVVLGNDGARSLQAAKPGEDAMLLDSSGAPRMLSGSEEF